MKMRRNVTTIALTCLLLLTACVLHAETVAEHFDRQMKAFAASCAKKKPRPGDVTCDRLKLKPADPLATEEGRFAHSIQIPNPVPEDSGYKPGMTSEEYFNHLCKTEAGEFIYKTVENIEGLYMMRPRKHATDDEQAHLYALEDPFGYRDWEAEKPEKYFVRPSRYRFFEDKVPGDPFGDLAPRIYKHYSGTKQDLTKDMIVDLGQKQVATIKSRYGYTWREIMRPHDRELGIVGGELIVMDMQSNEVLAVRRGFIRSGYIRTNITGIWWLGGHVCPKEGARLFYTVEFISRVLKPVQSAKEK